MSQYVVTRTWLSRHKKRTYHIAVGPFLTRAQATGYLQRAIRDFGYPSEQLAISTLRAPLLNRYEQDLEVA